MAASKASATLLNAVTTTQTSSANDISAAYEQSLYVDIVIVGTATTGAQWQPQWSCDGGTKYYNGPTYVAGLAAGTYDWAIPIPPDATNIKVAFTAQVGGTSSTCTAQVGKVTGI